MMCGGVFKGARPKMWHDCENVWYDCAGMVWGKFLKKMWCCVGGEYYITLASDVIRRVDMFN